MARGEWGYYNGHGRIKWWSYRRTTLIICSINIGVALYVLHTIYNSLYTYPFNDPQKAARYTPDQIRKMEESNEIRKASQPTELIKLVDEIKKNLLREEKSVDLPSHMKQQVIDEIVQLLKSLKSSNATDQNEAVERWRKQKIKEARGVARGNILNSTILPKEAKILVKALKSRWDEFREEIGLWIPVAILNKEHDDKPEGEEEFDSEILAGRQLPPECHTELHTDYGGAAVRWGLTHHKESAYDCCQACLDQAKNAREGDKRCNIWVYCPAEGGCYSPDIYEHKQQECWLKYDEKPQVSFKNTYSESFRNSHPNVPLVVPWVAGIVSV